MTMEKETTGIYLSGHPMDDYRGYLKNTHVVPIARLLGEECPYEDGQIVSVAGIVAAAKMKATKNNSMMAYVTLEDDTASMEMLAFSKTLGEFGGYLRENEVVIVSGRVSLRDDKDTQLVINRVRPISDFMGKPPQDLEPEQKQVPQTLYLRLPGEQSPLYPKVRAILNMFPGSEQTVVFFADTKLRRGTRCSIRSSMLAELQRVLGEGNVVVK